MPSTPVAIGLAAAAIGLIAIGWTVGGDDGSAESARPDGDAPLVGAVFAPDAAYEASVSAIFVAVDPTDAEHLIEPAPWCDQSVDDEAAVVDPFGPCADLAVISAVPSADALLDCRAEEAAVMAAAASRLDDTGRELDRLDSLVPTYLTDLPRHWDVVPVMDGRSAGIVPRAVGLCADLEPKSPPESLVVVECGAEYAIVTTAVESYRLEFGVPPASVDALAPAFLAEVPTNWTLPPPGDASGRAVVPSADGACAGSDG